MLSLFPATFFLGILGLYMAPEEADDGRWLLSRASPSASRDSTLAFEGNLLLVVTF